MIGFAASTKSYAEWLESLMAGSASFPEARGKAQARALLAGGTVLTVPVTGGSAALKRGNGGELEISDHGRWREVHLGTLQALYGRTPYFSYLFPEIERIYLENSHGRLGEFTSALHELACEWIGVKDERLMASLRALRREDPELLSRLAAERRGMGDFRLRRQHSVEDESGERGNDESGERGKDESGERGDYSIFDLLFRLGRESVFALL